ncbi:MAG: SIMPL domain-containing protein [Methylocystis sp.]
MIRLFLVLPFLFIWCDGCHAEPLRDSAPSLTIMGEAVEELAPDMAILRFGVVSEGSTAEGAALDCARIGEGVIRELEVIGVNKADIQTEGFKLTPISIQDRDPKSKGVIDRKTYRLTNELSVRLRSVQQAGEIVRKLVDRGVNSFQGVFYEYSNSAEKLDTLRAAAVRDAYRQAEVYASAAGLRLGRILEMKPVQNNLMQSSFMDAKAASPFPDSNSIPLSAGRQRIRIQILIVWALAH